MYWLLFLLVALVLYTAWLLRSEPFGRLPSGAYRKRVRSSAHFSGSGFQNLSPTPSLTEGVSFWAVLYEFFFRKSTRARPDRTLPAVKTDLKHLDPDKNVLVWFGHSSYLMQIDGCTFLVDPVLSGHASPFRFTTNSYPGTDIYHPDDFPEIDYLLISHDHWDHLDYHTVKALRNRVKQVVCGLGVASHLIRWGYDASHIHELDWNEKVSLQPGFTLNTTSSRHFSGRGFKRNQSLWMSYVLQTPSKNMFIGGDSGYDTHFADIGRRFGPFDWAILECGQYDKSWRYIHMLPEEVPLAAKDLNAKVLLPVHWAKFTLGNHDWDEPAIKVTQAAEQSGIPVKTPMIGAVLDLDDTDQQTARWWEF
jgi:L-ascorbate metabolism protein UlaG (beta-lactamase superfamily)